MDFPNASIIIILPGTKCPNKSAFSRCKLEQSNVKEKSVLTNHKACVFIELICRFTFKLRVLGPSNRCRSRSSSCLHHYHCFLWLLYSVILCSLTDTLRSRHTFCVHRTTMHQSAVSCKATYVRRMCVNELLPATHTFGRMTEIF